MIAGGSDQVRTIVRWIMLLPAAAGCRGEDAPVPPVPLPVTVEEVAKASDAGGLRYSASITPDVQVDAAFKVSGYVEQILQVRGADGRTRNVQDGDFVRRGTVLARVREREYRDALTGTQAALTKSKADFERTSQLYENRSVSKADYDAAYARFQADQAQVDQAEQSLADCSLRAPLDGYVLKRGVEIGTLVAPGTPAMSVGDIRSVKVVFGVPDVLVGSMQLGATQGVTVEAVPGTLFGGRITRVAPSADATSRVFEVEVTLPNPDGALKSGMIASLEVTTGGARADSTGRLVPLNAVVRPPGDANGYAVFVVEDVGGRARARLRRVSLGEVNGNLIQVRTGLQGGERVIVRGATLAVDSQDVRIIP
jgi:multidrug efflux system membrane fusion protein